MWGVLEHNKIEIVSDEMGMFNALLFLCFWNIVDKKLMTLMISEE